MSQLKSAMRAMKSFTRLTATIWRCANSAKLRTLDLKLFLAPLKTISRLRPSRTNELSNGNSGNLNQATDCDTLILRH